MMLMLRHMENRGQFRRFLKVLQGSLNKYPKASDPEGQFFSFALME